MTSFKKAFAAARKAQGAGGTFKWQGKTFTTNYKEEVAKRPTRPQARPAPTRPQARPAPTRPQARPSRPGPNVSSGSPAQPKPAPTYSSPHVTPPSTTRPNTSRVSPGKPKVIPSRDSPPKFQATLAQRGGFSSKGFLTGYEESALKREGSVKRPARGKESPYSLRNLRRR